MTEIFHGEISFLLIAGAFLVASGFFVLLRGGAAADFLAGILLAVSGVNIDALAFSRHVTGISRGEIFSLFTIVAALGVMISVFVIQVSRPAGGDGSAGSGAEKRDLQ
jgi:hypothetical protein